MKCIPRVTYKILLLCSYFICMGQRRKDNRPLSTAAYKLHDSSPSEEIRRFIFLTLKIEEEYE